MSGKIICGIVFLVCLLLLSIPSFAVDTTVNTTTTWLPGIYTFGSVTVNGGATLYCKGDTLTGQGVTINCDNLTVDAGSKISADLYGYSKEMGPGGAPSTTQGSGYGGRGGGYGSAGNYAGGNAYGSITQPSHLGSGGKDNAGGGLIIINCTGTVTLNGDITANGGNGVGDWAGGASGGSVWITTATLSGNGKIYANGGQPGAYNNTGACGAGGRIAVYFANNTSGCSFIATTASNAFAGGAGTVYLKKTGTNGILIVDNSGYTNDATIWNGDYITTPAKTNTFDTLWIKGKGKVEIPEGETLTVTTIAGAASDTGVIIVKGTLVITGNAVLTDISVKVYGNLVVTDTLTIGSNCYFYQYSLSPFSINNLYVQNNGKYLSGRNTTSQSYIVNVSSTNIIIDTGGAITTDNFGYTESFGLGVGTGYGGGGYGGRGGIISGGMGGIEYGLIKSPSQIGSGGAQGWGGGFIKLVATGNLTNNGTVSSNGASKRISDGVDAPGAGSGGGIYVSTNNLSGNGTISATGGTSANDYGGGGGGRVAIYYSSNSFTGNIFGYGGPSGATTYYRGASSGTIFLKSAGQANGDLIINNNNTALATTYTYLNEDLTVDTLYVMKKGIFVISQGVTLTVLSAIAGSSDTGAIIVKGTLNLPTNCNISNITITNSGGTINEAGTLTISNAILYNSNGTINVTSTTTIQDTGLLENILGTVNLQGNVYIASNGRIRNSGSIGNSGTLYVQNSGVFEQKTLETVTLNNVVIQNGGVLTQADNSNEKLYVVNINANSITIDTGGKIDVLGKGYDGNFGPGVGTANSGAGYGGRGGWYPAGNGLAGNVYGSITSPNEIGSGGDNSGGGYVKLVLSGALINNGTILADGAFTPSGAGGGSGGGIYIYCSSVSGNGTISALGGTSTGSYGGGGGGRIALYYATNNFSGYIVCNGGPATGQSSRDASAGTIYLKPASQTYGDLTVDNNGNGLLFTTEINSSYDFNNVTLRGRAGITINSGIEMKIFGNVLGDTDKTKVATLINKGKITHSDTLSFSNLNIINDGGTIDAKNGIKIGDSGTLEIRGGSVLSVNNINVENGGLITHTQNTNYKQHFISINTTYFYVKTGGRMNADFKGYIPGYGPGYGWSVCGGSYGGKGGNGNIGSSGSTYGIRETPNDLGSGGGGDTGGGMIYVASQYFINDGLISANGAGYLPGKNGKGGGSGGSVYIRSAVFSGSGQITTSGGDGYNSNPYSGGGGGGRVAVYYYANNYTGSYNVNGSSTGYDSGYAGTTYFLQTDFLLPPNQPDIITPSYGGPTTNRRPAFTFIAPTDLENNNLNFEIQISTDGNFSSVLITANTSSETTGFEYSTDNGATWQSYPANGVVSNNAPAVRVRYTTQQDLSDGNYYWRVKAIDVHGSSIWSATGVLPSVTSQFSMRITSPQDNTSTYEEKIKIEGNAYQTVSQRISRNGADTADLTLTDNEFSIEMDLAVGLNTFTVTVYNKDNALLYESVNVRRVQLEVKKEFGAEGGIIFLEDGDGNESNNSRIEIENGTLPGKITLEFKRVSKTEPVYEINGYSGLLKKKVKLCLRFDGSDLKDDEKKKLKIHWWDGFKWQALATTVDVQNEIAYSYVNHFSKYAVIMSGEENVKLLEINPVFLTPNGDNINDICSFNVIKEGTFNFELKIFDVDGKLVKVYSEKDVSGGLLSGWDGRDEYGRLCETGVYICVFKIGNAVITKTVSLVK